MKNLVISLALLGVSFCGSALAGTDLKKACSSLNDTEFKQNVLIQNYNVNSIHSLLNVRLSDSKDRWYSIRYDNPVFNNLYDITKVARITGEKVDVCVGKNGYLLGIEWAYAVN